MHNIVLYPQNGDRIVTIDSVTSLHPMYNFFNPRWAMAMIHAYAKNQGQKSVVF